MRPKWIRQRNGQVSAESKTEVNGAKSALSESHIPDRPPDAGRLMISNRPDHMYTRLIARIFAEDGEYEEALKLWKEKVADDRYVIAVASPPCGVGVYGIMSAIRDESGQLTIDDVYLKEPRSLTDPESLREFQEKLRGRLLCAIGFSVELVGQVSGVSDEVQITQSVPASPGYIPRYS